jgi:hypothetical protein
VPAAQGPDEPVRKTGGSSPPRRPPRTTEVTRSEEVRPSSPRQTGNKVGGAAKTAAPRPRRTTSNGSTSSARKPAAPKKPPTNGNTGEQPIVMPERANVDLEGPTWAETIATLTTPDELDPDDIAILTGWTTSVVAPDEVVDAPAFVDHLAPEFVPVVEPTVEPLVEEAIIPEAPAPLSTAVTAEPEAAAVSMNPARAFTLWRRRRPRVRKVTRIVRRIDAWSVLKVSVLFYLVLFVILLVAGVLLWNLAQSTGTVRNVEGFIRDLFNLEKFDVSGRALFRASWTLGVFLVIAGTGLNVTMAVLFNLISDLVGGVRVTVLEEEVVLAPRTTRVKGRRPGVAAESSVEAAPEPPPIPPEPPPIPPVESVDGS